MIHIPGYVLWLLGHLVTAAAVIALACLGIVFLIVRGLRRPEGGPR